MPKNDLTNNIESPEFSNAIRKKVRKQGCVQRIGANRGRKSKGRIPKNKAGFKARKK